MERSKVTTAMKRIRIGKDISLRWEILTNGVAMPLEGRDLTVELKSPIGTVSNIPFSVDGSVIIMTYYGYEQKWIGDYSLTLWENKGHHGQSVVDAISAFKLVRTSPEEEDFIGGDLKVESVDLGTANLDILKGGGSTTPDSTDIANINATLREHTDSIRTINTSINSHADSIRELNATITKQGNQVEELTDKIEENSANIAGAAADASDALIAAQGAQTTATTASENAGRALGIANEAKTIAEGIKGTADAALTKATDASGKADAAETDAIEAKNVANSAQGKNTEQDARLDNIEARIDPDIAGRVWNEDNGTPKAESYYGSVKALRDLPKRLGLGRYLVEDVLDEYGNIVADEKGNHKKLKKKLDPNDSRKYLDGTPAALDGSQGQCMWCWNGFYANVWKEGSRLIKAVTFDRPVGNDISIWIPAGGISWLGAGVIDRGDAPYTDKTKWTLCSLISDDERYRGGGGTALDASKYTKAPADTTPQITMLGMPATNISTTDFGTYARKRGEGWEANWFVARFVVEFLFEIIMGTENSQEAFNANKDANGLYQGGFGDGVTGMVTNWGNYNGSYPLIPTSVGLEAGDNVCLVEYKLPQTNGADGDAYRTFQVPVFFGLVGAGFGNLWQTVRGLIVDVGSDKSLVYVANSMYEQYNPNTVEDKIMVEECTREYGYILRKSYRGLCCIATEAHGGSTTRYADEFQSNTQTSALYIRFAGGSAYYGNHAGASQSYVYYVDTTAGKDITAPLCYFTEDPIIPDSQSIANNN